MEKREDEPFSGLVYVLVIDFSLFLLTLCCIYK